MPFGRPQIAGLNLSLRENYTPRMRTLLILLLAALPLYAGGKKIEENRITFHVQGVAAEVPKMAFPKIVKGRQYYFRRSPEASSLDVQAYRPFPAADGTFGMTLQLNPVAGRRMAAITSQHIGKWMLCIVNGRAVDAVTINAPVRDNMLVIWQGLHLVEVQKMSLQVPLIGETNEDWKKRTKELKKTLKKELKKKK